MNIIDSSLWLEYFAGTAAGNIVSALIEPVKAVSDLIVPSITLYEVFKKLLIETNEASALLIVAHMKQGKVINLDDVLALEASLSSIAHKLPMADSFIYATAEKYNCTIWTQDKHFSGLKHVKYFEKQT
jgi:predicted nucleic acid-binding protein